MIPTPSCAARSIGSRCRCARRSRSSASASARQMLARQLGATVAFHPNGMAEVGYYPIRVTPAAKGVVDTWPAVVYQWHREGFELPAGADLLAEGDLFKVQAFRYGPAAYGIQFHAEVTHAMMCRWTTRGHERMALPGAKPRADHFVDRPVYDLAIRTWLFDFLGPLAPPESGQSARIAFAQLAQICTRSSFPRRHCRMWGRGGPVTPPLSGSPRRAR